MRFEFQSYPALIVSVAKYEHRLRESIEQFKATLELADGSYLHVNEVWISGELKNTPLTGSHPRTRSYKAGITPLIIQKSAPIPITYINRVRWKVQVCVR